MIRECDGRDSELLMYLQIDGQTADDPEFAVIAINCDCGSRFDDTKHDLVWPHRYIGKGSPRYPVTDLPDIAGLF